MLLKIKIVRAGLKDNCKLNNCKDNLAYKCVVESEEKEYYYISSTKTQFK